MPANKRFILICLIMFLMLLAMIGVALVVGSAELGSFKVARIINSAILGSTNGEIETFDRQIVMEVRLPRIILAIIVGAALSMAGVIYQSLFRNPMAEPSVIGTSSGAALGATLAIATGLNLKIGGLASTPLMAFTGAILATILVYRLAKTGTRVPMAFLLLAGIAVSTFLSSAISLIMILRRDEMYNIVSWLMGGFASRSWMDVVMVTPYVITGFLTAIIFGRELNLMLLGEERARQLGLNSDRLQKYLIIAASLLVAGAVSVSGIIGFVGLLVPHMVRFITGPDHKYLLPVSGLAGGLFLLAADTMARTLLAPLELPVGVVTSLSGVPFFIYLLMKNKRTNQG
jgi:iron complex transport system permease protein